MINTYMPFKGFPVFLLDSKLANLIFYVAITYSDNNVFIV